MVTLSLAEGAPAGFQFVDVFQAVLVAPVQVFCAKADDNIISARITNSKVNFFIKIIFVRL
jgi:hypothetical protein